MAKDISWNLIELSVIMACNFSYHIMLNETHSNFPGH